MGPTKVSRRKVLGGVVAGAAMASSSLTTRAWAQANKPIRIGFLNTLSGPQEVIGRPQLLGAQIAVEQINKDGGIMGRQIELVVRDDKGQPAAGVAAAKELAGDGVNLIAGFFISPIALAIAPVAMTENFLMMATAASVIQLTHENFVPNFFRIADQSFMRQRALGKLMAETVPDVTRWGGIVVQIATGQSGWEAFSDGVLEFYPKIAKKQPTLTPPVAAKFSATDYKNEINEGMKLDVEGLYYLLFGLDAITFLRQAAPYGFAKKFRVMADAGNEYFVPMTLKSDLPPNYWSSFHWYPEAHRGNKISDALEAAIKDKTKETYLSGYHSPAHSAILAYANGIKRADGKTDSESVMKAMEGMTFDMSKGKATFRKEDHQAIANIDYVRFDPDPSSSQGWKVSSFKSIDGADVIEPPSPGKPVTYQYYKKS